MRPLSDRIFLTNYRTKISSTPNFSNVFSLSPYSSKNMIDNLINFQQDVGWFASHHTLDLLIRTHRRQQYRKLLLIRLTQIHTHTHTQICFNQIPNIVDCIALYTQMNDRWLCGGALNRSQLMLLTVGLWFGSLVHDQHNLAIIFGTASVLMVAIDSTHPTLTLTH